MHVRLTLWTVLLFPRCSVWRFYWSNSCLCKRTSAATNVIKINFLPHKYSAVVRNHPLHTVKSTSLKSIIIGIYTQAHSCLMWKDFPCYNILTRVSTNFVNKKNGIENESPLHWGNIQDWKVRLGNLRWIFFAVYGASDRLRSWPQAVPRIPCCAVTTYGSVPLGIYNLICCNKPSCFVWEKKMSESLPLPPDTRLTHMTGNLHTQTNTRFLIFHWSSTSGHRFVHLCCS